MLNESYKIEINEMLAVYFIQPMINESEIAILELYGLPKNDPYTECDVVNGTALVLYQRANDNECLKYYYKLKLLASKKGCTLIKNSYASKNPLPAYTVVSKFDEPFWWV